MVGSRMAKFRRDQSLDLGIKIKRDQSHFNLGIKILEGSVKDSGFS